MPDNPVRFILRPWGRGVPAKPRRAHWLFAGLLPSLACLAFMPASASAKVRCNPFTTTCQDVQPLGQEAIVQVTIDGMPTSPCDYYGLDMLCVNNNDALMLDPTLNYYGWPGNQPPPVNQQEDSPYHNLTLQDHVPMGQSTANDQITSVSLTIPQISGGFAYGGASSINGSTDATVLSGSDSVCSNGGDTMNCSFVPAGEDTVRYGDNSGGTFDGALTSINVVYNYGGPLSTCGPLTVGGGAPMANVSATTADACTPPSHTRITKAAIKRHAARFGFTGKHAKGFYCQLFRDQKLKFGHSCRSPKAYASHLPAGKYVFEVAGVGAGVDAKPAREKFTIK
jgi:hypothetical protein